MTLPAELLANDQPLLVRYDGHFYFPVFRLYPETTFGGIFETEADYRDPEVVKMIDDKGWIVWPPIPYRYDTMVRDLPTPAPSPPTRQNWLGTDDQARDVASRLIYGFRISVLFGLHPDDPVVDHRHRRRRRAGLLRRPDRPLLPALHRDLVEPADALPADHPREHRRSRASGGCSDCCCSSRG